MSNPPPIDPTAAALLDRYDALLDRITVLAADAIAAADPKTLELSPNGLRAKVLIQVAEMFAGLAGSVVSSVGGGYALAELESFD